MTLKKDSTSAPTCGLARYAAQIRLPEIGNDGQLKLRSSRVLIIGCGALGSIVAPYLAGAGVGTVGLADFDTIEESNLHRQVVYSSSATGQKKVEALAKTLRELNPEVSVRTFDVFVRESFLRQILEDFDFVIDAADNPSTTYMVARICSEKRTPYVTAGVSGWQARVFTFTGRSVGFDEVFPQPDGDTEILPCSIAGIFGPLAGIAACVQASEAVKFLLGINSNLADKLLIVDLLDNRFEVLPVSAIG